MESGCGVKLSDERATIVSKIIAVGFGILGYGVVFLVKYLPGVLEVGPICRQKYINYNLLAILEQKWVLHFLQAKR